MDKKEKIEILINRLGKLKSREGTFLWLFKIFSILMKLEYDDKKEYIKQIIKEYYLVSMPDMFYDSLLYSVIGNLFKIINVMLEKDIYLLINYIERDHFFIEGLEEEITPSQYYDVPKRYIDMIIELLKKLELSNNDIRLKQLIKNEDIWLLKRNPRFSDLEYMVIAYKIYLSIGLNNGIELLNFKYGDVDYEEIYFLFSELDLKNNIHVVSKDAYCNFLFNNKKDYNNVVRRMLDGRFNKLFLNFDYFYNNINYFVSKLGTRMSSSMVDNLLGDRYLTHDVSSPEISGDITSDMLSSYYCKYNYLDVSEDEIYNKNFKIYDEFLRNKYKSSIPSIVVNSGIFRCEILKLNDPRNLVLGYRTGNCFRINGDASILFNNFLKSEHMRLLSISTLENKDYAMMLIMRNGNVLIGQGIEVSKRVSDDVTGKPLYDVCRLVLKQLMDYMNSSGDEIVATIIGSSNSNVSNYNNNILSFLINPILDNSGNYYNGIYNYQCLLDISDGKTLNDIKLYIPDIRYLDEREAILRRNCKFDRWNNYMELEKRLISLRSLRVTKDKNVDFYMNLFNCNELYTACNRDWYITLFDNGIIDGYIYSDDDRAREEYNRELEMIKQNMIKKDKTNSFSLGKRYRK